MDGLIPVALFFADGRAFFAGAALVIAGALVSLSRRRWAGPAARLSLLVAAILVTLSATPLAWWAYASWGAAWAWALIWTMRRKAGELRRAMLPAAAACVLTVASVAAEAPYLVTPNVGAASAARIVVIGDSISAGVDGDVPTWPSLVAREVPVPVVDLSQAGETMKSAMRSLDALQPAEGQTIYIVEIGGNDMLERLPLQTFEADLDALLGRISDGKGFRTILIVELPLPPFFNGYGRVQRDLAEAHGALLVPKRRFSRAFDHASGTLDGLHLSAEGHQVMAREILGCLGTR